MKLAISLTTYQREDGKSSFYLHRALQSVLSQTHKDFHIFLVGDRYENENEFLSIVNSYAQEQISYYNLEKSIERDKYGKNHRNIYWDCAGVSAMNFASEQAVLSGFDYVCHLDHDDYWSIDHLEIINDVIENLHADWVCTQSLWGENLIPVVETKELVIPFLPVPCGVINSSTCYNYKTIPLKYRHVFEECGRMMPSDADLWERMAKYFLKHNLFSYFINKLTCFHEEEGYLLNESRK